MSSENDGIKYLLTCIDVFSKYGWVRCLKTNTAVEVCEAFKEISSINKPKYLQIDQGSEFFNRELKAYLKSKNIVLYATRSNKKASIVERFNLTIRNKLGRYFTHKNTNKYIDILENLVSGYNHTIHGSIKEKPSNVNANYTRQIFKNLYGNYMDQGPEESIEKFKFHVNDHVRIVKYKALFTKGSIPNWTREIFTIYKIYPTLPPAYSIKDLNGEVILGDFYENELQKIEKDDNIYQVERIIRRKGVRPNRKYYVKWLGYPDSFNSWIDERDYDV